MQVASVTHYDLHGGAARAAYRIHQALRANEINSTMLVNAASSGDWTVQGPIGHLNRFIPKIRHASGALLTKTLKTQNPVLHSAAVLHSGWARRINDSSADVIHLHWINHEMMSIEDVANISKPIVWTLHDMWGFCGAEHYSEDFRWRDGYHNNRPAYESGFDLNRWVWNRKRKAWKTPMHIVAPSQWLAECARKSKLMQGWPVSVINNALDTEVWRPVDKAHARALFGLPKDVPLLLFGALGGTADPRKGFDLLLAALENLRGKIDELELVVFGQLAPKELIDFGFPVRYVGRLHDDLTLAILYSAVDVMVVPSRQEAFGQTASEAHACGTPVVAFDSGGLTDIVKHLQTGYLAMPFDPASLAEGIIWVLSDRARHASLSVTSRQRALDRFSYPVVAEQYRKIYELAVRQ
jgi:glycosyltransferase involved in cell wall biosynthesis